LIAICSVLGTPTAESIVQNAVAQVETDSGDVLVRLDPATPAIKAHEAIDDFGVPGFVSEIEE
jgi:hypothetical protein